MDVTLISVGWVLIAIGVLGCFVPVLPGPPIAYASLYLALATGNHDSPSVRLLMAAGVLTAAVLVLDYVVPAMGAKKFNCSRLGMVGCFIGTFAGLFFLPFGVVLGPFLGALTGEILAQKGLGASLKGAMGALLGYVFGILLKLAACGFMAYWFWRSTTVGT